MDTSDPPQSPQSQNSEPPSSKPSKTKVRTESGDIEDVEIRWHTPDWLSDPSAVPSGKPSDEPRPKWVDIPPLTGGEALRK